MSKRPHKSERPPADAGMKSEYDFAGATRGRFYRKDAVLVPPVHLEPEILAYLQTRAEARGTSLSALVNALLRKDIEAIEAARLP